MPPQAQIVKTNLAKIGIRVDVKAFTDSTLYTKTANAWRTVRHRLPRLATGLPGSKRLPEPAARRRRDSPNPHSTPRPTARLARAAQLTRRQALPDIRPSRAADLARHVAPLIAFGNASSHDLFSARIGCQTYGIYGIDLAALCIKHPP
jgi:hypothetical protein